jgi:hypothetical protein
MDEVGLAKPTDSDQSSREYEVFAVWIILDFCDL